MNISFCVLDRPEIVKEQMRVLERGDSMLMAVTVFEETTAGPRRCGFTVLWRAVGQGVKPDNKLRHQVWTRTCPSGF
ncbi:unnamed protein product [Boreogadus saida]